MEEEFSERISRATKEVIEDSNVKSEIIYEENITRSTQENSESIKKLDLETKKDIESYISYIEDIDGMSKEELEKNKDDIKEVAQTVMKTPYLDPNMKFAMIISLVSIIYFNHVIIAEISLNYLVGFIRTLTYAISYISIYATDVYITNKGVRDSIDYIRSIIPWFDISFIGKYGRYIYDALSHILPTISLDTFSNETKYKIGAVMFKLVRAIGGGFNSAACDYSGGGLCKWFVD